MGLNGNEANDNSGEGDVEETADAEKEEVRKNALEFILSLSKAKPGMVDAGAVARGCLEGMGEIADDDLDVWLEADVRSRPSHLPYLFLNHLVSYTLNHDPWPQS